MAKWLLISLILSIGLTILGNLLLGGMGFFLFPFIFLPFMGKFFMGGNNDSNQKEDSSYSDKGKVINGEYSYHDINRDKKNSE